MIYAYILFIFFIAIALSDIIEDKLLKNNKPVIISDTILNLIMFVDAILLVLNTSGIQLYFAIFFLIEIFMATTGGIYIIAYKEEITRIPLSVDLYFLFILEIIIYFIFIY